MHLPSGTLLKKGQYRVDQKIGQGGFGITYKGIWYSQVQSQFGTMDVPVTVAIKEFFFRDYCEREEGTTLITITSGTGREFFAKFKEKLLKEAVILSQLNHLNVVKVLDAFEENGTAYLVMEFLNGQSLKEILATDKTLPVNQALYIADQLASALAHIHEKKILHLDLKPSNVMITGDGKALLIDFGISKRYDESTHQETSFTQAGLSKGFSPPEQYVSGGVSRFMPQADIYSLGATIYQCMTGEIPPEATARMIGDAIEDPGKINPQVTSEISKGILKAMNLRPAERHQTAREFIESMQTREERSATGDPEKKESQNRAGKEYGKSEETVVMTENAPPGKKEEKQDQKQKDEKKSVKTEEKKVHPEPGTGKKTPWKWVGIVIGALGVVFLLILAMSGPNEKQRLEKAIQDSTVYADSVRMVDSVMNPMFMITFDNSHDESIPERERIDVVPAKTLKQRGGSNITFDSSGSLIATKDGMDVKVINVLTGESEHIFPDELRKWGQVVCLGNSGREYIAIQDSNLISVCNCRTGSKIKKLDLGSAGILWGYDMKFSPDDRLLAWAGLDGRIIIKIIDVNSGDSVFVFEQKDPKATSVFSDMNFSHDGNMFAFAGTQSIYIHNMINGVLIDSIPYAATDVAFSPYDNNLLFTSGSSVYTYNLVDKKIINTFEFGTNAGLDALAVTHDGSIVAASGSDVNGVIKFWSYKTGKLLKSVQTNGGNVNRIIFSPDDKIMVSASDEATTDPSRIPVIKTWKINF